MSLIISKVLEGTLNTGQTSITFTDSAIPNSFIRLGSTDPDLMPVSQSISGNSLTITYEPQSSSKGILVNLVKEGLNVIDDLTSSDSSNALSAKQGKTLKELIDGIGDFALSDLTDVNITSLSNGDILIYDSLSEKFINQSLPSIPENISDLDDVEITNISYGQVLAWNDVLSKFVNVNQSGGGASLDALYPDDTNEHQIGDNLYIKKYTGTLANTQNTTVDASFTHTLLCAYGTAGKGNDIYNIGAYFAGTYFASVVKLTNALTVCVGSGFYGGTYTIWAIYRKVV